MTNDEIQRDLGLQDAAVGAGEPSNSNDVVAATAQSVLIWDDNAQRSAYCSGLVSMPTTSTSTSRTRSWLSAL
jgi:hypothetical protein